jgi:pimeloyl-ACP methyl ester carboxylesterase
MTTTSRPGGATTFAALALAAAGSALWVEHRSRAAERRHHAPHDLVYVHGTRLHFRLEGEGPPVMLVHGNQVDGADFEASGLVERLARHHQVLVIDRPGFGHSDRLRGEAWTPAQQARLLHHAANVLGVRRPVVVGHSMGAQVAIAMALQEPHEVAGLVLVGGYYWPSFRLDRWLAAPLAVPILGDVLRYTSAAWTARAAIDAMVRAMFHPMPVPDSFFTHLPREMLLRPLQQRATAEDGSHLVPQARVLAKQYGRLRLPVTLVAGAEDKVVAPEQSQRLHEHLPHSRLHLVAGAGHMAHYAAPDTIVEAVAAALADSQDASTRDPIRNPSMPPAADKALPAYSPASASAD